MSKYPYELLNKFNIYKRNGLIPILSTISFNIQDNLIEIFCDSGRLTRPIFYMENKLLTVLRSVHIVYHRNSLKSLDV